MENTITELSSVEPPKSSTQIEHDMERTRESITDKVEALENQVLGTIQDATDTVTETVGAVKEAVSTAPTVVRDTLREIIQVVKESVGSFSAIECIRNYPAVALGSTAFAGFLTGYLTGGRRVNSFAQPLTPSAPIPQASIPKQSTGLLSELFDRAGGEVRQLADQVLTRGIASLKQNIEKRMPEIVDTVVERMTGAEGTANRKDGVRRVRTRV
jgi:ElaB/YqjD/DUF883 family membrane-anchored ribosome-binding protein